MTSMAQSLDALHRLAQRWSDGGYQQRYADALLQHGRYLAADAQEEAGAMALVPSREHMEPYFPSRAEAEAQIAAFREHWPEPAIFVLGSGNIGFPLIINVALGLIADKRVFMRASRANAAAVQVWLDALQKEAGDELARRVEVIAQDYGDKQYHRTLARLPVQQAYLWGGGEALSRTAAPLADAGARIYELGPRTGVLLLDADWWRERPEEERKEVAQACYDNLLKYDAALCSTPTLGLVIGAAEAARQAASELCAAMTASDTEQERLRRLPAANAYRRQMQQWEAYGYALHRPPGSLVTLASAPPAAFERKQRFASQGFSYHDAAATLELISFAPDELAAAADLVARLPEQPRYQGLWSVGHIITAAGPEMVERLLQELEICQRSLPDRARHLAVSDLRQVDIRHNIGRHAGDRFDGVDLVATMLAPE